VPSDGVYMLRFMTPDSLPFVMKSSCKAGSNRICYSTPNEAAATSCFVYTPDGLLISRQDL
jgi:hypothetical protein